MEEVVTNIFGLLLDCGKLGWGSTLGVDQAQTGYSSREGSRAKEEKEISTNNEEQFDIINFS